MNDISIRKDNKLIDVAKFIAALFVVGIHVSPFKDISPLTDYILFKGIGLLAVPFFFTLSAYFLFSKMAKNPENSSDIIKGYAKRLLILYGFWFIPLLPYTLGLRWFGMIPEIGGVPAFFYMIKEILLSSSYRGSWFLNASIIGGIIAYLTARKTGQKGLTILGIVSYAICLFTSSYQFLLEPYISRVYNDRFILILCDPSNTFIVSLVYFALARYIAMHKKEELFLFKYRIPALIVSFSLMMGEVMMIYNGPTRGKINNLFMVIPTIYFLVLSLIGYEKDLKIKKETAYFLRQSSIIIYIIHFVFSNVLWLTHNYHPLCNNRIVYYIAVLGLSLLTAVLILKGEKKEKLKWLRYAH